jgi:hypothetical protein
MGRYIAILAAFGLIVGSLFAQSSPGSIEGKVTDAQQAALNQTTVELEDATGHVVGKATTDEAGHYRIAEVSPGTYTIRFTQTGFEQSRESITVLSGKMAAFDATLKPQPVREVVYVVSEPLTDVEPTGSKLDLPPLETPAAIVEMNSNTLSLRGYQQIEEAVEAMPGATSGGSPADPSQFATRGFVGNQVTLLRDGIYIGPQT